MRKKRESSPNQNTLTSQLVTMPRDDAIRNVLIARAVLGTSLYITGSTTMAPPKAMVPRFISIPPIKEEIYGYPT